jgi:hypothetical protein
MPISEDEFVKRCEEILELLEQATSKLRQLQCDVDANLVRQEEQKHK